ncbi:retrotransposon protein, putative, ty1-copia subclass [Tanacetum coccineum]
MANSDAYVLAGGMLYDAYMRSLNLWFEKQVGVERFDLIQTFHTCKHEEGKPVGAYVLKMKDYVEQLERLGYVLPQDLSVGLILKWHITSDFTGFVKKYNMQHGERHNGENYIAMLIEYEKGLPKKAETPQGKGNDKHGYIPKPKNPKPTAKEHPAKDDTCHHCKEDYALEYAIRILNMVPTMKASGSNVTFLILYVDDIIIMGNHIPSLQSVKDYLGKCFAMKDLGEAAFILGIKIYRDRSKRLIGLSQSAYMDKILKRYRMDNSKRGHIPMQERLDLNKTQGASTPEEVKRMQNVPYASVVGSIMYAVRCTRPDVAFAQNITSRFQTNMVDRT